jgi:hypothetical protein
VSCRWKIKLKEYQTFESIKKEYEGRPDLLDKRLRQLSEEYGFFTPNINSNGLCVVKSPSIWKYAEMTLSVMGEGFSLGRRGVPINSKLSVANYWANDFGTVKFQKWW